jgi:hypothetical protein
MSEKEISREQMIEALVSESINYIRECMERGDVGLLADYLSYGFTGYENMSESDLQLEYESNVSEEFAI